MKLELYLLFLISCSTAQVLDLTSCRNAGECVGSTVLHHKSDLTLERCKELCLETDLCHFFTWFEDQAGLCLLHRECDGYDDTLCQNCFTGEQNCVLYECFQSGFCQDNQTNLVQASNANDCLEACKQDLTCNWFSYANNTCSLSEDCLSLDMGCGDCIYGQVECNPELFIMVTAGDTTDYFSTDIVDVINMQTFAYCRPERSDNPLKVSGGVGLIHEGNITTCSGQYGSNEVGDCRTYDPQKDSWELMPFEVLPVRQHAASVEFRPGEWIIMGGVEYDLPDLVYKDTMILQNGIFVPGPDLPLAGYYGNAVMLNETHLFFAYGYTMLGESYRNYMLDINSQVWTQLAERSVRLYRGHVSGTFYNSTANEIQVATLGRYGIETYSPQNDQWTELVVPNYPNLRLSAAVQRDTNSFLVMGGVVDVNDDDIVSGNIYEFGDFGFKKLADNVFKAPRCSHIAMKMPKSQVTC